MSHTDPATALAEDGFCVLGDVIPADRCEEIAERIIAVVADQRDNFPSPEKIGFVPGLINHEQSFAPYLVAAPLMAICDRLLGQNVRITFTSAIVNHPGNQRGNWHADWPFNQHNAGHVPAPYPDRVMHLTTLWMITEFTRANGGTLVVEKSHLRDTNPTAEACEAEAGAVQPGEQQVTGPAGSVLVMDSRMWHATAPNTSTGDRIAIAVRYAPWWLNTEILRPGSDTRRHLVDEPGLTDNQVPSLPRQVYDRLPTDVQPLYRHWIEP